MTQLTKTTLRRLAAALKSRLPLGAAQRFPRPGRRSALIIVVAIILMQGLAGTPAMAQNALKCTDAPAVERPGAGMVGKIDPPVGNGLPDTAYLNYSYAGMVWHTYDTYCVGSVEAVSTWIGNRFFDAAKVVAAATNAAYHMQETSDQGGLAMVDEIMVKASRVMYQGVFSPWLMLAAAIAGAGMLFFSLGGNLSRISKRAFWVIAGLTFASATYLTPTVYTTIFDGILGQGVRELRSNILTQTGDANPDHGTRHVLPALVHDQVVWQPWLEGEFGSADSPKAKEFGPALLDAQAWSTAEVAEHKDGDKAVLEAKNKKYKEIAGKLKGTDAYPAFRGEAVRVGAGIGALIQAIVIALFQLLSNLALFLAMLLPRLIVGGGAVIGLAAMVSDKALPKVGKALGTSVWTGIQLAIASLLHLVFVRYLTALQINYLWKLVFLILTTGIMWAAIRPGRKLHSMITTTAQLVGVQTMPFDQLRQYRQLKRLTRQGLRGARATERVADSAADAADAIAEVVDSGTRHRPEASGDTPRPIRSERMRDPDYRPRVGALGAGADPVDPAPPAGSPGAGGTPGGATTYRTEASTSPTVPATPRMSDTHPRGDEMRPGAPHPVTPEVIIPSRLRDSDATADRWREAEAADRHFGPQDVSPSSFENGRVVHRVYRPSTGRIEEHTNDPGHRSSRPETEGL